MYKVSVNKLTYGRRTYEKGSTDVNELPLPILKNLAKGKKIEKGKTEK